MSGPRAGARRACGLLAAWLSLACWPVQAAAQAQPEALVAQANRALEDQRPAEALRLFEQALAQSGDPRLHLPIARCNTALGRFAQALEHYQRFIHDVPAQKDPEGRSLALGQIDRLERARALNAEGNAKLDQHLLTEALALFERAYEAFPSPRLHFNIAQCHAELGRPLAALEHYERFVQKVPKGDKPQQWELAQSRIFALQGQIATVLLQANVVDATVTADGAQVGQTPLQGPLRFLPGPHALIVSKPGHETRVVQLALQRGQALTQRLTLATEAEAAATRRAVQQAEAQQRAAEERLRRADRAAREERERTGRALRWTGYAGLTAGVGLVVVGGIYGLRARDEASQVEHAAPGTPWRDVSAHDERASTYRSVFTWSTAAGAVLAVAGGTLWFLGRGHAGREAPGQAPPPGADRRALHIQPVLAPGAGVLLVEGAF